MLFPTCEKGFEEFCNLVVNADASERTRELYKVAFFAGIRSTLYDIEEIKNNHPSGIVELFITQLHEELDAFFSDFSAKEDGRAAAAATAEEDKIRERTGEILETLSPPAAG